MKPKQISHNTEILRGSHQERTFVIDGHEICIWDVGFAIKARINSTENFCYEVDEAHALWSMILLLQDPEPRLIVND